MDIKGLSSQQYQEVISLHYKKSRSMDEAYRESELRKQDPKLDQMLYDADKAQILGEISQVREILMKIACGETLSEAERKLVREQYPEMEQQAQQAKETAQKLKDNLQVADVSEAKTSILTQAASLIAETGKNDALSAGLLAEAMKQVVRELNEKPTQANNKVKNKYEQTVAEARLFNQQI